MKIAYKFFAHFVERIMVDFCLWFLKSVDVSRSACMHFWIHLKTICLKGLFMAFLVIVMPLDAYKIVYTAEFEVSFFMGKLCVRDIFDSEPIQWNLNAILW